MIYSILIYEAPGFADARPADEREQALEAHRTLQRDAKRDGAVQRQSEFPPVRVASFKDVTRRPQIDVTEPEDGRPAITGRRHLLPTTWSCPFIVDGALWKCGNLAVRDFHIPVGTGLLVSTGMTFP